MRRNNTFKRDRDAVEILVRMHQAMDAIERRDQQQQRQQQQQRETLPMGMYL